MKKIMVLLGLMILCLCPLIAEEPTDELEKYEIQTKGRIISFVEKDTKKVIKTINKVDDNPFMQRFGQKKDDELGVLDISIDDLESIDIKQEWLDLIKDTYSWAKAVPQIFFTNDKKYIVISYNLSFGSVYDEGTLFSIAHIFLYNCKGEQIGEAYFNDRVCGFPVLSDRAEYLGFKFEFPYDASKDMNPTGFAVYDFKQNKLVVEDFVPKGYSGAYPAIKDNQMSYLFHDSDTYIFINQNFNLKKTYRKTINREKYGRLLKIEKEGLYFKTDSPHKLELLSFEKDFEKINW